MKISEHEPSTMKAIFDFLNPLLYALVCWVVGDWVAPNEPVALWMILGVLYHIALNPLRPN
jgi:hypothetical protein